MKPYNNFRSSRHHRDDLKGVPDHLFSHNDLTFFGDFIGKTFKLHPNMECCVRLEVACLLVVVNRKIPPSEYFFRRSGVVIHKTSDTEDAIASENSKLIDIEKPVLEVANLNLTTDETITQNSAIVASHDKESSPATGYNGEVPVKEVNDKVKVQEDNDEWSTVPHNNKENQKSNLSVNNGTKKYQNKGV
ncbi:hypothetical protein HID58_080101 [Brassica napus]|uniref:Uncharacterized protein n=1 Tax=Brassica napus TaxID=3708 RepID=A0ABQ7Y733_BRANA|nr:hypothetical protein HID58_080101 [Brassica napus]